MLEILDMPAQGRLRHVKPLCSATKVQFLGDRNKTTNLRKIEHRCRLGIEDQVDMRGQH